MTDGVRKEVHVVRWRYGGEERHKRKSEKRKRRDGDGEKLPFVRSLYRRLLSARNVQPQTRFALVKHTLLLADGTRCFQPREATRLNKTFQTRVGTWERNRNAVLYATPETRDINKHCLINSRHVLSITHSLSLSLFIVHTHPDK